MLSVVWRQGGHFAAAERDRRPLRTKTTCYAILLLAATQSHPQREGGEGEQIIVLYYCVHYTMYSR